MAALSIVFLVPNGEPSEGFFPDTLLARLCASAREAGHRATMLRVYYDGRDPAVDETIRRRLLAHLAEVDADLVVFERLVDVKPLVAHRDAKAGRLNVLVSRGDSFDPVDGVDFVVGGVTGTTRTGATRRMPTAGELLLAFERLVAAVAEGRSPRGIPGVPAVVDGVLADVPPLEQPATPRPFEAVVEQDVIAPGTPPAITRKTLFGNSGCPYADDPLKRPLYRGLALPVEQPVARLGCAFCSMGGDYEKRPDAQVVRELVEQARFWTSRVDTVTELVLNDQHSLRYLATLVREAADAGVRPVRWLFAARADAFVRERAKVLAAIEAARSAGHVLETYLTGFEAFSDVELERYNKGTTVDELIAAIDAMRTLAIEHPDAFRYAAARGHSLILWNPWTTPADLAASVDVIRRHGLTELFHELARNRLRLYRDLPIFYAAERDGALVARWEEGDEGGARRQGYNVEHPWRFLESRTRVAYAVQRPVRERLRLATEVGQLRAVSAWAARLDPERLDVDAEVARIRAGIESLETALGAFGANRPTGAPPHGTSVKAAVVHFAGGCNNGCEACANRDRWQDDRVEALRERVAQARMQGKPIVLAGREPTIHPAILELTAQARGDDGRRVGIVTNGRRFAHAAFARSAVEAGLTGVSVKVFAPDEPTADAISRDAGGWRQALAGLRQLAAFGVPGRELRAPLHRSNLASLDRYVALAGAVGATQIRIEAALDAVGLDALDEAAVAVGRLASACARAGVALEASPLDAGTGLFEYLPVGRR